MAFSLVQHCCCHVLFSAFVVLGPSPRVHDTEHLLKWCFLSFFFPLNKVLAYMFSEMGFFSVLCFTCYHIYRANWYFSQKMIGQLRFFFAVKAFICAFLLICKGKQKKKSFVLYTFVFLWATVYQDDSTGVRRV